MGCSCYKDLDLPYFHDDGYRGYEIEVDRDPDPYQENLQWMICINDEIWDVGTGYSLEDCLMYAKEAIDLRIADFVTE